jgi:predicted PurR-regulated permease PerM
MKQSMKKYVCLTLSLFAALAMAILFFFMIYKAKDFSDNFRSLVNLFKPFIYGGIIAYLLAPLCGGCEDIFIRVLAPLFKKRKTAESVAKKAAVAATFIIAAFVVYIFLQIVMPQILVSITTIIEAMPGWIRHLRDEVEAFLLNNPQINEPLLELSDKMYEKVQSYFQMETILANVHTVVTQFSSGVFSVIGLCKNVIIGVVAAVYMLASRKKFRAQAKKIIYGIFKSSYANAVTEELRFADTVFSSFITGKVIDSAIIGVMAFFALTFMKMPYVVLLSVIIGVTNIIPFFGPFIGAVPCFIIVLMVNPMQSIYFLIFIVVLQQIDGNIIGPKILGSSTGLSGFWVFFSILLFGGLWGFAGMVIGVPLFAVIYDVVSKFINHRLKAKDMPTETDKYLPLEKVEYGNIINHEK